eukprot:TRINITY_DN10742_c0_g1_i3.p1 TRINITY_DN10742_c0_g1~~TRINITY_DN10742_c0_g1_i3.p1  ORF type:complete len:243 (+),score=40.71 TRINITY_DN10742_c0_g1_i3:460-1188(+)
MLYSSFSLLKHTAIATLPHTPESNTMALLLLRRATLAALAVAIVRFGGCLLTEHSLVPLGLLMLPPVLYVVLFGFRWEPAEPSTEAEQARFMFDRLVYRITESVFYVGVLPPAFVKHDFLYFDHIRCTILAFYVVANAVTLFTCQQLLCRSLSHIEPRGKKSAAVEQASSGLVLGASVLFSDPNRSLNAVLMFQLSVTISQFVLLLLYRQWIWIFVMLVGNLFLVHWVGGVRRRLLSHSKPL